MREEIKTGTRQYLSFSIGMVVLLVVCAAVAWVRDQASPQYAIAPDRFWGGPDWPIGFPQFFDIPKTFHDPRPFVARSNDVQPVPVYVVKLGDRSYIALYRRDPYAAGDDCWVKWNWDTKRFVDPCAGSEYSLTGTWLEGPSLRGLDRFGMYYDSSRGWIVDVSRYELGSPR